jgi:hypothetical protein
MRIVDGLRLHAPIAPDLGAVIREILDGAPGYEIARVDMLGEGRDHRLIAGSVLGGKERRVPEDFEEFLGMDIAKDWAVVVVIPILSAFRSAAWDALRRKPPDLIAPVLERRLHGRRKSERASATGMPVVCTGSGRVVSGGSASRSWPKSSIEAAKRQLHELPARGTGETLGRMAT